MACRKNCAAVLWIGVFLLLSLVAPAAGQQAEPKVLTLQEAERMALENHPGIRAANERIKVQEALLGRARAAYYPTFGARGTYENKPRQGNSRDDEDLYNTTGEVGWLLSDFGRREGTVRREEDTLEARRFTRLTSVEEVVFMVRRAFFDYLRAQALVGVEQDTVKDREALVRQARGFFDVGTRPKIDVARAEAGLFAAKAGLIAAQNGVRIAWGAAQERHGRDPIRGASGGGRRQHSGAHPVPGSGGESLVRIAHGAQGVPIPASRPSRTPSKWPSGAACPAPFQRTVRPAVAQR